MESHGPLHPLNDAWFKACEKGQIATLAGMCEQGFHPDMASATGVRSLSRACREKNLPLAKTLLKLGANPNLFSARDGQPLACATRVGSLPLVQYLLDRGALPDAIDEDGHFALLDACSSSQPIFHALLQAGADPDTACAENQTALMRCVRFSFPDGLNALIAKGARVDAVDLDGATALMHACSSTHPTAFAMVQSLLAAGANPNHATPIGWTPLMEASEHAKSDLRIVDALLEAGADIGAVATLKHGGQIDALGVALNNQCHLAVDRLSEVASRQLSDATLPVERALALPRL